MARRPAAVTANGTAIRAFRQARGFSAKEVIEALHTEHEITFSRAGLYNIELEHKNPSPKVLNALAAVLRVPVAALLNESLVRGRDCAASGVSGPTRRAGGPAGWAL